VDHHALGECLRGPISGCPLGRRQSYSGLAEFRARGRGVAMIEALSC
jgi:hypothetical protein